MTYAPALTEPTESTPIFNTSRRPAVLATVRTVGGALVTLCVISIVVFVAMNYHSGDQYARELLGHFASAKEVHAYALAHHLDDPLAERYVQWLSGFVHADWGNSPLTGFPVAPNILQRLPRTILLAALALPIGALMGSALGAFAAVRMGTKLDLSITLATTVLAGLPEFVLAIGLLIIFAVMFHVAPIASFALSYGTPLEVIQSFILPTFALALVMVPHIARITRASARDVSLLPYVQSATLRGLPPRRILWNHVVRNAMGPIANVIGLEAIELLSGVIVVENVFSFPGIGQALVTAVGEGDSVTVETIVMIMGVMFILITLITDLVVLYFNPRLRVSAR